MNESRRKRLRVAHELITEVREEEQEAFDNSPEGLQGSARGQAMEEAISNLDEAIESIYRAAGGE
jgi:hypothetical protein